MNTPEAVSKMLAKRAKAARLAQRLTQQGLAARAGISLGSLKRFERTGQISLHALLKIALVLGTLEDFKALFTVPVADTRSLDALLRAEKRPKRGSVN